MEYNKLKKQSLGYIFVFVLFTVLFFLSIGYRIEHTYLEDDSLWLMPEVEQIHGRHDVGGVIQSFFDAEMGFTDGVFASVFLKVFNYQFPLYTLSAVFLHLLTAILIFYLCWQGFRLSKLTSFFSALIYLSFYGHTHSYLWPLAAHHLVIVFFSVLYLLLYLKIDQAFEAGRSFKREYIVILLLLLIASWQRISILIIPLSIFVHILFTSDKDKIVPKFDLWMPVFFIFPTYQAVNILSGQTSNILKDLMSFAYEWAKGNSGPVAFVLAGMSILVGLFVFRFLLKFILSHAKTNFFAPIIRALSVSVLFFPKVIFLCLTILLFPFSALHSKNEYMNWQRLVFPVDGLLVHLLFAGALLCLIGFLIFMFKKNKHLIVFIPWYLLAIPYLSLYYTQQIPSKYLIYASPFFSCMVALICFEMIPKLFTEKWRGRVRGVFSILIALLLVMNLAAINVRTHQLMVFDYHLSYDYIKIADVIADDLKRKNIDAVDEICIEGVGDIPHKEGWKSVFLWHHDFERMDSFRQTFASVLGKKFRNVSLDKKCGEDFLVYRFDGVSVVDKAGVSVEPFYHYFDKGLDALQEDKKDEAQQYLEQALESPPHLLQWMLGRGVKRSLWGEYSYEEISHTIFNVYANQYNHDKKLQQNDYLIYREATDYAKALALLAYVNQSKELMQRAYLFASQTELVAFAEGNQLNTAFHDFVISHANMSPVKDRKTKIVTIENYKDFNIYWFVENYFAIPEEYGMLELIKYKAKAYQTIFVDRRKHILRAQIDQYLASNALDATVALVDVRFSFPVKLKYKLSVNFIPLGDLEINIDEDQAQNIEAQLLLSPFYLLKKVSDNGLGLEMIATIDKATLLPHEFKKNTFYRKKKGKGYKEIQYDHKQLYMQRSGYQEDIEKNTRDMLSTMVWLLAQDFEGDDDVQSMMNISRSMYNIEVTSIKKADQVKTWTHKMTGVISKIGEDYVVQKQIPFLIKGTRENDMFIPSSIQLRMGVLILSADLNV